MDAGLAASGASTSWRSPRARRTRRSPSRATRASPGRSGGGLGELHAVLSRPSDDPAFAPETATEADREGWAAGAMAQLDPALDLLRKAQGLSEADKATAEQLLGRARGAARRHLAPRAGRGGRLEDARPWRLPPRPGAGGAGRCGDRRFRGRAGAEPGGAPRQGQPAPRRRRAAALLRLRGLRRRIGRRRLGHRHRGAFRAPGGAPATVAGGGDGRVPAGLPRRRRGAPSTNGCRRRARKRCSTSS